MYYKELLKKYKTWFENPDSFTAEVAAFEYLKRNPYFIETTNYFIKEYKKLEDKKEKLFTFKSMAEYSTKMNLDALEADSEAEYEIELMKQIWLKNMETTYKRIFLYTGEDVFQKLNLRDKKSVESKYDLSLTMAEQYIKESPAEHHYPYSDIYHLNESKFYSKSFEEIKRSHIIDIDEIFNEDSRWLRHLRPSLYVKINPTHTTEKLRDNLQTLLKKIEGDWAGYASPEMLLNEGCLKEGSFQNSNKFRPSKAILPLLIYDLTIILKENQAELIKKHLDKFFESIEIKYKCNSYFSTRRADDDFTLIFNKAVVEEKMKEVKQRINHKYLNYIYSENASEIHFKMLKKDYVDQVGEDIYQQHLMNIQSFPAIEQKLEDLILHVKSFNSEEYETWSESLFKYSNISQKEILEVILL